MSINNHKNKTLPMRIELLGAAGTVTGSRTLIRHEKKIYLIDCGLFQGPSKVREKNWTSFPVAASEIAAVILTHAHLDHSGFLPRLQKEGFKGPIYCSQGTADLCDVLWRDSARIQEEDAEYANKTSHSRHKPAYPLYKTQDVEETLKLLSPQKNRVGITLSKTMSFVFREASHIIGANFVELTALVGQRSWRFCFSGDIGHERSFTLRGPEAPSESDFLLLESTYGDREHDRSDSLIQLAKHIQDTCAKGGILLIPSFAVGRAQELLYMIRKIEDLSLAPSYPVLLDSPMAHKATDLFLKHQEAHQIREDFSKIDRYNFFPHQFEAIETPDDSFASCMRGGPLIIISAAGMLSGGRILHHLKHRLPDEKNKVLFVGYQGEGTKGRFLLDYGQATGTMRIHHAEVNVNAKIECMNTLSAHGDQKDLLKWIESMPGKPSKIVLNHGEKNASNGFKDYLLSHHPLLDIDVAYENMKIEISEKEIKILNSK